MKDSPVQLALTGFFGRKKDGFVNEMNPELELYECIAMMSYVGNTKR